MKEPGPHPGRAGLLHPAAAKEMVLAGVDPLPAKEVPLDDAEGRFTAVAYVNRVDLPGFDNSAMDGFALASAETPSARAGGPVRLRITGESRAGLPYPGVLRAGEAVGISTGAVVPEGADAVLRREDAVVDGENLFVSSPVESGRDIRRQGEVMRSGEELLPAGTAVGPVETGILATTGVGVVRCHRRPRLTLLTSGDELIEPGEPLAAGQIWNSNSVVVSSLARRSGAEVDAAASVGDDRQATVDALDRCLEADLTVVCGGVSVGDHDHVKPALAELGVEEVFWGLALKPGRPAWFGRRGGSRVLGLPGNPVSAFVVFQLLADPLIRRLAGAPPAAAVRATLAEPVDRLEDRDRAVPCRFGPGHELIPLPQRGSHDFISLRGADCLAMVASGTGRAEPGEQLEILALG